MTTETQTRGEINLSPGGRNKKNRRYGGKISMESEERRWSNVSNNPGRFASSEKQEPGRAKGDEEGREN